jgi:hypothetical protein
MHIINTTESTQVVKVRLRRGADSKDALDFNLVMSPLDEWTANIGPNPDGDGVRVTTGDTTCTVPEFPADGAVMPTTFAEGAEEGYVEIIAMGQAFSEGMTVAVAAEHDDGVPASCAVVRQNFYRVSDDDAYGSGDLENAVGELLFLGNPFEFTGASTVRGVHYSDTTSSGLCTANAARTGGACDIEAAREGICGDKDDYSAECNNAIIDLINASLYVDSDDAALKVSWMITDSDGGLEIGDNAVMVEGFSEIAMVTNQELLDFGVNGILNYDPLNFELPNLSWGVWNSGRSAALAPIVGSGTGIANATPSMMPALMDALDAEVLINDWAAFDTDAGTVATDWVVTLPGQYTMQNPICDMYESYSEAATACAAYNATANVGVSSGGALDEDQLPLVVADGGGSNMLLWDREEMNLNDTPDTPDTDLGFSPGGSAGTPADTFVLNREVNVIMFNDGNVLGTADLQDEDLGLGFVVNVSGEGNPSDRGWSALIIEEVADEMIWSPEDLAFGTDIDPNDNDDSDRDGWGYFVDSFTDTVAVVGFAAWERSFADQAGNYGRAIEHSTVSSSFARSAGGAGS